MKFMLLSIILSVSLITCNIESKTVKIKIFNESRTFIDSIKITTYNLNAKFTNLRHKEKHEQEYKILNRTAGEGAFLASVFVKDSIVFQGTFGYHSSLNDMKSYYIVVVNPDYSISEK